MPGRLIRALLAVTVGITVSGAAAAEETPDYLSFANGAIPVDIDGDAAVLKADYPQALAVIDGNPAPTVITPKPGGPDARLVFVYELPGLTTFHSFAVPNIGETPSPSQTFFRQITVTGSSEGPNDGFVLLASAELQTHPEKGETTRIDADNRVPVRWLKLELSGGIDVQRDKTFYEFSELQGFGEQEPVPLSERFNGQWKGRGVLLELRQDGALVNGCYDRNGDLSGAVTGNILHATGVDRSDGTRSVFVLNVTTDGELRGVRSSNGAPFRIYEGSTAPEGTLTNCSEPTGPALGCGAIVYGIRFGFDSADISEDSAQVLDELHAGLEQAPAARITIQGHTSSEGSETYNQSLSERRARAVVAALVDRGLDPNRVSATGLGETMPIASNDGEAGRSLNRRVEVHCSEGT